MWLTDFFKRLFKRKKKDILWDENALYDHFVNKYSLSVDGDRFYQAGNSIANFGNSDEYIDNYINPLFENLKSDLHGRLTYILDGIKKQTDELDNEKRQIQARLDAKNESGFLFMTDAKINTAKNTEKEIESLVFPEKEFQKMLDKALKEFHKEADDSAEGRPSDEEMLAGVIKSRETFKSIKQLLTNFKGFLDDLSPVRHSLFFPPNLGFIRTFYFICLLLLVAEMGFSMTIIKGMLAAGYLGPWANPTFSVLYAIGAAVSFAILFKALMEAYLFKKQKNFRTLTFILIIIYLVLIVLFLFSDAEIWRQGGFTGPTFFKALFKALILAFFSMTFAIANALLFREASYLHHLHFKVNGRLSLKVLVKSRREFISKWESRLNAIAMENRQLSSKKVHYEQMAGRVAEMFANLKTISVLSYRRGVNAMLATMSKDRDDLSIILLKKLKAKL